jgi:hypothetical protein
MKEERIMKFRLEDSRWRDGAQDLNFSRGGNTSSAVAMTWNELLNLRNFLDAKLAERERELRATDRARHSALRDDDNVSLHVLEG